MTQKELKVVTLNSIIEDMMKMMVTDESETALQDTEVGMILMTDQTQEE
jgi:hypothetical protein